MSWYGKIIGGSVGAIFGPAGMMAGASFGHYYDSKPKDGQVQGPEQPDPVPMSKAERNSILFNNTFAMMAKMAKADGYVTQEEVDTVKRFMAEPLLLNAESRSRATKVFNKAKNDESPFDPLSEQFALAFRHDIKTRAMMFEMLLAIALSDGVLHPNEDRLLLKCLNDFHLNIEAYTNIRRDFLPEVDSLYSVLGIAPDSSDADIKKKYRQLSREYHPDKMAAANVSDSVKKLAEEKFKEINQAYDTICRLRNMR